VGSSSGASCNVLAGVVVLSYSHDMMTTQAAELSQVLDDVTSATRALSRSADVPPQVEELVHALDARLHADAPLRLEIDPYLSTTLFAGALRAMKALRHDNPAEQRRDLRVALEHLRHALRDVVDGAPVAEDVPVRDVLFTLNTSLNAPQRDLAELLSVSTRQLQRWLDEHGPTPTGADEARIRVVAQIVNHLRHAFTAPGVLAWFWRTHPHLGHPPAELLDDPISYPDLRALAAAARSMAG
jgi:hypothetical protein